METGSRDNSAEQQLLQQAQYTEVMEAADCSLIPINTELFWG